MYSAKFIVGWLNCECKSDTLNGLVDQLCAKQDLSCLVNMGLYAGMGEKKDIPVLKKLEKFISKYESGELTEDDIRKFNYHLSLGNLVCTEFKVTDD